MITKLRNFNGIIKRNYISVLNNFQTQSERVYMRMCAKGAFVVVFEFEMSKFTNFQLSKLYECEISIKMFDYKIHIVL